MVPPKLTPFKQNSLYDATGRKSQRHSFQVRRTAEGVAVIPLLYNGSHRIGLLTLARVRPFNSEVHSASALLLCLHHLLHNSLEIALKRTRPRQRFCYVVRYSMTEGGGCQEAAIPDMRKRLNRKWENTVWSESVS